MIIPPHAQQTIYEVLDLRDAELTCALERSRLRGTQELSRHIISLRDDVHDAQRILHFLFDAARKRES